MIGIVILNYMSYNLVFSCVDSIKASSDIRNYHIYIVDNGSNNESLEELNRVYKDDALCTVIDAKTNKGFSYGNNIGAKRAYSDGCKYILFSNSDVIFLEFSIQNMMRTLKSNNAALVYPVVYDKAPLDNKNLQIKECMIGRRDMFYDFVLNNNVLRKIVPKFIFNKYFLDLKYLNNDLSTNMFFGCCFMVKCEDFFDSGALDENTFLYYEEHILSTRLLKKSYNMYISKESNIIHLQGASSDKSKSKWFEYASKVYYLKNYKKYNTAFIKMDFLFNKIYSYLKCRSIADIKNNNNNIQRLKEKLWT